MAVKVKYLAPGRPSPDDVTHDDGESFKIEDGHLVVSGQSDDDGFRSTVAAYAPGRWISAVVV